jgi:hypothetical protein
MHAKQVIPSKSSMADRTVLASLRSLEISKKIFDIKDVVCKYVVFITRIRCHQRHKPGKHTLVFAFDHPCEINSLR